MGAVTHYIEVNAPVDKAYGWWRGLTNLPAILPDVRSVEAKGGDTKLTHWVVDAPLGRTVEWDAMIVEDVPDVRIAWASDEGSKVENAGAVRFDEHGQTTGVECSLQYDPPAGMVGEVAAKLFADPQQKVERALAAFKEAIESDTAGSDAAATVK